MPTFIRLVDFDTKESRFKETINNPDCGWSFRAHQRDFHKIPGSPIAYWMKSSTFAIFMECISKVATARLGMATGNNDLYLKTWNEVSFDNIGFNLSRKTALLSKKKWFPYCKGGDFKKYYGNNEYVVDWQNDGYKLQNTIDPTGKRIWAHNFNLDYIFSRGLTWTFVSSAKFGIRYYPNGFLFDSGGPALFTESTLLIPLLSYLSSPAAFYFLNIINPTLNFQCGNILALPYKKNSNNFSIPVQKSIISVSKSDWDLREISWDFRRSPILTDYSAPKIDIAIDENLTDWSWPSALNPSTTIDLAVQVEYFKRHWTKLFVELHHNEEEKNSIFIDLYGLQDELTPDVPYTEITILQEELLESARREQRIEFDESVLARQFVSYGVGCLMGRYSIDKDGLILADAGATLDDFKLKVPHASFLPDEDAILPLTDEDDFSDDLPTRFKAWLRVISGTHFEDNLQWIEDRLGKDLRSYFIRDFYKDHLRRYKNRPIYWMISSPSGSFRTLMYLHRYSKDTVSKVLNDYLRPYRNKIEYKLRGLQGIMDSSSASQSDKVKAKKRAAQLEKISAELDLWEKDVVYPTALARIELDLDDGVKVNYRKLSAILEPVKQLEAKDEE